MRIFREKIQNYAFNLSQKGLSLFICFSFLGYFGIIIFGFAPINARILESGYSTGDLQSATTSQEVATILNAWKTVMDDVILLSILDYCFIFMGLLLFITLYLLLLRGIPPSHKWTSAAILGILITVMSRTLDALENLWAILIYTNPNGYAPVLIPILHFTESIKWVFVAMEYIILFVTFVGYYRIRKNIRQNATKV